MRMALKIVLAFLLIATACTRGESGPIKKAQPGATPGGTITLGITPPGSLEPSNAFDPSGQMVIRTMCDSLLDIDPKTGELRPAIAESWQLLDDGYRFTLKLREGVRFHNGEEVKADDVVFSLSRVADREYASAVAELLRPVFGFEELHGEVEVDNEDFLKSLAGVRSTEEYGVEITLGDNKQRADFIRLLAHPLASPVPKETVLRDPDGFARKPICAGPYRMTEPWDPSKNMISLERFDGYYGKNRAFTRGGRGYADRIQFRIDQEIDAAYAAHRAGNSDLVQVPGSRIGEAIGDPGFIQVPSASLEYLGLPLSTAPFDNPDVRVALSQALDRQALVQSAFGGGRIPATGLLPPSVGDVYRKNACPEQVPAAVSIDAARAKLNESGVQLAGTKIKLYFNEDFSNRRVVESVASQWKAVFGLESELIPMPWQDYIARATASPTFDGPFRMSWAAEYPSPDRYLFPLFHSDSIGSENFTRFASATFDRLMKRSARRAPTEADLKIEYRRLETLVCRQMPVVPLTFGAKEYLAAGRIASATGSLGSVAFGQPPIRELYVRTS